MSDGEDKLEGLKRISPLIRLITWLDYPKVNRLDKKYNDLKAVSKELAKQVSFTKIESNFLILSYIAYFAGNMVGRPVSVMAAAQLLYIINQYWVENNLKKQGILQYPL
jgi:hypothetical protein